MMMNANANTTVSWAEQNQAYLSAQFASAAASPLGRAARRCQDSPSWTKLPRHCACRCRHRPPSITLAELFKLTSFERSLLLLCAGVEMDSRLADACAQAQGHPQRTYVSFGLAMALFDDSHWDAITPSRPLRRFRMIELQPGNNLTSAPLRIDERILHYLAGENALDPRLQWLLRPSPLPGVDGRRASRHRSRAAQLVQS